MYVCMYMYTMGKVRHQALPYIGESIYPNQIAYEIDDDWERASIVEDPTR